MSYEQNLMNNDDFLLNNPTNDDEQENRPNYATTLEKYNSLIHFIFFNNLYFI